MVGGINVSLKTVVGLAIACLAVPSAAAKKPDSCRASKTPRAVIDQGTYHGSQDKHGNAVFLGIPFAATTGGENRWRPPQPLPHSKKVFKAESYGPICPQAVTGSYSAQSEDCLNLNVWAPAEGENLPVFVYMYGGAMVTGSSSNTQLQGNNFARKGVVYVNFNTRESIFASPHSSELQEEHPSESQNFSILDVEKALEWVRENIRAFGGNPDHVVFGGHSSGGVQVDHYLWNHPDTWLKAAIEMSANSASGPAYAPVDQALNAMATEVGCPAAGKGQIKCLRKVEMMDFETTNFNGSVNTYFTPVIDGITRHGDLATRFRHGRYPSHIPLITGNSNGEGTIFSIVYGSENTDFKTWINTFDADSAWIPDLALIESYKASEFESESLRSGTQYGDARFNCAVDYLLDLRSEMQNTWVYRFYGKYDNVVGPAGTAPTHGTEVPFFHGGNECFSALSNVTHAEQALADLINNWFIKWIKNPEAGPGWPKASPKNGIFAKLGVPGNELAVTEGRTSEYNARCKTVYKPRFQLYPVIQSIEDLIAKLTN